MSTDVYAIAGEAPAGGATTYAPVDGFDEFTADDGFTRTLARNEHTRATAVVFVNGQHTGIIALLNQAAALKHERSRMVKYAGEARCPDWERAAAKFYAAELAAQLEELPKVKAQPTLHQTVVLEHYSRVQDGPLA